jgi:hypothetical protein
MLKTVRVIEEVTYRSEVRDDVKWISVDAGLNGASAEVDALGRVLATSDRSVLPPMARVIEWADAHPNVYAIVTETRSAAFGKDAACYYGIDRGEGLTCMLGRIRTFMRLYEGLDVNSGQPPPPERPPSLTHWLAKHTYWIYDKHPKELQTGVLVQWDGRYVRNSVTVDSTRKTFGEVLGKFLAWYDDDKRFQYKTDRVIYIPSRDVGRSASERFFKFPKRVEDMTAEERQERTVWTGCQHPSRSRKLNGELVCDQCRMTIEVA